MFETSAKSGMIALALLFPIAFAQNSSITTYETTGFPPCDALISANLTNRVLLASSPLYEPRVQSYWAANARVHPWCFFLPETTSELSTAIKALATTGDGAGDWHIAVRSGGHMYPGSNTIVNGVTIDLGHMNGSWYDAEKQVASIQPGGRWRDVYKNLLDTANVMVTGGRDGDVGVGGFLLGGGNSYHSGANGFGCDTVVNFEVVLANGTIVNANAASNPDLYKALKGGGLNFGIVTRFDVLAMPAVDLAYGISVMAAEHSEEVLEAVVEFTERAEERRHDHLITFYTHEPGSPTPVFAAIRVNTKGDLNTTSFDGITKIPALEQSWDRVSLAAAANTSQIDAGKKGVGGTLTLLNSAAILRQATVLSEELVASLSLKIGAENFTLMTFYQPLPSYYSNFSKQNGGNVLGLDRTTFNAILWGPAVGITGDDGMLAIVQAEVNAMVARLKDFAEKELALANFVYLNYADPSQDPLGSYGPENVVFLRTVAERYDPQGWWQRRVPGGFKLSRVGN